MQEQDIRFVGIKPAKGNIFPTEVKYKRFNAFTGYFYLSGPLRKTVREIRKTYPDGHLVLQQANQKWLLLWICDTGKIIELGDIANAMFKSIERGWTDLNSGTFPIKKEVVIQKDSRSGKVLWIRYRGMTFYKSSNEKFKELILGLVTGQIICPGDERIEMVLKNLEQYKYSRNGYDWASCPNDIRRLTAPRKCVYKKSNF